ncbi:MAG TPA: DNA alkylation repair protein [Terriglobales bacterium]|nr:DNA alkylation repair protein [Terriglobales bacterium]
MRPAAQIADHIRRVLKDGGSAPHSEEVQWFFKEEVASRGWYTQDLRRVASRFRRQLIAEADLNYLVAVADELFQGQILEEKVFAVFLLEKSTASFGQKEFRLFETWLDRISTWADHDGLLHYLIGPLILADSRRAARVFRWARSSDRWHRRAAAVALIRSTRQKKLFPEIVRLSNLLLPDQDDMVQKGLGWLLRETAKADRARSLPYLERIAARAPRLVLRTACETLLKADRQRILALPTASRRDASRRQRG